jgi:predicted metal-binding protein
LSRFQRHEPVHNNLSLVHPAQIRLNAGQSLTPMPEGPLPVMTSWITICDTCKREGRETGDMALTDGERLAALIESASAGIAGLRTRRVSCTMGCERACNVTVQARGKLNYTLGRFEPTGEAADAIVAWATLHHQSATGQVPYRQWPLGVKGHFVTRHPPLPEDEA